MVDWVPRHVTDDELKAAMRDHGYVVDDVDDMPRSEIKYLNAPAQDGQRYGTDTLPNRMTRIIESVVVDLLDGINVHVSGSAGMGKSVLVRNVRDIIRELTGRPVITCAPTGIAAVNVDGHTVYSEFGGDYDIVKFLDEYVLNLAECPSLADIQELQANHPDIDLKKLLRDDEVVAAPTTEYGIMHPERFKVVGRPKGAALGVDADEKWWRTYNGIVGSAGLDVRPEAYPGCHLTELMALRSPDEGSSVFVERGYDAREFIRVSLAGWNAPACIIVDEISMCSTWQFEAIAEAMKRLNGRFAGPGLRVPLMVVGDFMQLCPVVSSLSPDQSIIKSRKGRINERQDKPPAGITVKKLSELSTLSDRDIIRRVPRFYGNRNERWVLRNSDAFNEKPDDERVRGYYAFDSHLWDKMDWSVYELTEPLRQREEAEYARALRLVRVGDVRGLMWIADYMDITPEDVSRQGRDARGVSEIHGGNTVVERRNGVLQNEDPLVRQAGDQRYDEHVHVAWAHKTERSHKPARVSSKELPVPEALEFANQAYVMLTRNSHGFTCVEKDTGAILPWPVYDKHGNLNWGYDDDESYLSRSGPAFYNGDRGRIIGVLYDNANKGIKYALVELDDRDDDGKPIRVVVGRMQLGFGGDYLSNPVLYEIAKEQIEIARERFALDNNMSDNAVLWRCVRAARSQEAVCKPFLSLTDIERINRDLLFNQWPVSKLLDDPELAANPKRVSKYYDKGCDYLPMVLAYAYTYHKSQGQTLGMTDVDINGVFTLGQFYVGISRCEKVSDLRITGFGKFDGPTRFALLEFAMNKSVSREARAFDTQVTARAQRHVTDEGLCRLNADVLRRYVERYPERERDRIGAVMWAWLLIYEQHHSEVWKRLRFKIADGATDFSEIVDSMAKVKDMSLDVYAALPETLAEALRRGWPQRFYGVDEFRCAWESLYAWLPARYHADAIMAIANFDDDDADESGKGDEKIGVEELRAWRHADVSPGGHYIGLPVSVGHDDPRDGWLHQVPVTDVLGGHWFSWFEPDDRFGLAVDERGDVSEFRYPERQSLEEGLRPMAKALGFDVDMSSEGGDGRVFDSDFGQNSPNRV